MSNIVGDGGLVTQNGLQIFTMTGEIQPQSSTKIVDASSFIEGAFKTGAHHNINILFAKAAVHTVLVDLI